MTSTQQLASILWHYHHLNHPLKKADVIIGLGSYDLRVAERCAQLYKESFAPWLLFTGHAGNWTRGLWNKTEAEVFADTAINKGVSPEKILIEPLATNIGENIRLARKMLNEKNIPVQTIIIVTKPNTERRSFATVKKEWPEVDVILASPEITLDMQVTETRSFDDMVNEMVGDTQRIKKYGESGFQIPQEIPVEVWEAYEELVKRGFDKHLMK